ncbi:thioredoxin reductase [Propionigenium maris DSM 9537]|uniref:Thioredoxin reductase n=1 Tax=Propionigenium maris DSM 9537 TaxID=1123000 RepID=A0A9W6GH92_9FUSO|nr:FAD-dependent oxidoreductase [Propionigenium maris]GLI55209.1 thioredoxin reductase [Propionigenium maris DSM 9537]
MEHIYDVVIIGGGPAGLSAGVYAGRAKMDTVIIEKGAPGGQAATTSEIANYPGIMDTTGPKLVGEMHAQAESFGVSFIRGEVVDVDFEGDVKVINLNGRKVLGRSVIIATGAKPRKLGFTGEKEFTGRGVAYCATCDGEFFTDLEVFVIGAGYAAVEEAMFLSKFASKVTIIAREPEFTCAKSIVEKLDDHDNIEVRFNTEIVEASGDGMIQRAIFIDNITGEKWIHEASEEDGTFGIFVFIGYQPQTDLFKGHVKTDDYGYIITDENMRTNSKGIYAAGDLRPKVLRQVVTAVADGAIAATDAEKYVEDKKRELGIKDKPAPKKEKKEDKAPGEGKKGILEAEIREQLKGIFGKLTEDLKMVTVVDETNDKSVELKAFLEEIEELSDRLTLEVYSKGENPQVEEKLNIDKYPAVAFTDSRGEYRRVKFHGVPGGHELNSFILAIYNMAGPGQELTGKSREKIGAIQRKRNVKVAVSLSCHLCPDVVVAAQRIAIENDNIEAEMIDISNFKELRSKFNIMSVPAIIVDDSEIHFGAKSLDSIADLLK